MPTTTLAIRILPSEHEARKQYRTHRTTLEQLSADESTITPPHQRRQNTVPVVVPQSPDDHLVTDLPLLSSASALFPARHWAGHLPASATGDKYFFYWLFAPSSNNKNNNNQHTNGRRRRRSNEKNATTNPNNNTSSRTRKGAFQDEESDVDDDEDDTVEEEEDEDEEEGDEEEEDTSSSSSSPPPPLVIWLNGGPACSSMDGLFLENGPFRLTVNKSTGAYEITPASHSWHNAPAYTLYIDQPVGTGLSFTTTGNNYPTNDAEINADFYYFLQQFFALYHDTFVGRDATDNKKTLNTRFFFSGESYAGHYIPSLINYILKQNEKIRQGSSQAIILPVTGAAIGNGWTDPYYQYAGAGFAFGQALIGAAEVAALELKEKECQKSLNQGQYSVSVCFDLIDDILAQSHGGSSPYKASGYDVRKSEVRQGPRMFPPGHKVLETYLGGQPLPDYATGTMPTSLFTQVLTAIHATAATNAGQHYFECTDPPYEALAGNDGKGVVDDVVAVLKHPDKVQLLFFNGIHDMVCNHVSNEKWLDMLPWEHTEKWMAADRYAWVAPSEEKGQVSGYMREYDNLLFLKVMNAGHMVPMDVPSVALDMMTIFVNGGDFRSYKQSMDKNTDHDNACPICPTCVTHDSAVAQDCGERTSRGKSQRAGTIDVPYVWLLAGIGFVTAGVAVATLRRRRGVRGSTMIPQYELELRSDASYTDRVIGDENGDVDRNGDRSNSIT